MKLILRTCSKPSRFTLANGTPLKYKGKVEVIERNLIAKLEI
jgi:hypothetical protein